MRQLFPEFSATASQRAAIEAPPGPALVLAGPGAGKTYCLIERIRFLIERATLDPSRIYAFTFTNKAAEEIASRLDDLGPAAQLVKRGTIHAFCAELLRQHGHHEGLERGFGIADENYQRNVLSRLGQPIRFHNGLLATFTLHRLKGHPLSDRDAPVFADYVRKLERKNVADFDMLVVKAAHLLETNAGVAAETRKRWDYILVDEFQDLNPRQYEVVRALAREHRNIFAVGDDEQSIFSWTGADLNLFGDLQNDFGIVRPLTLRDNHRCPKQVFDIAKSLVNRNPRGRWTKEDVVATHETTHPLRALNFGDDVGEEEWLLKDLRTDREQNNLQWGDYAILYRKHEIGASLEASLVSASIPCRLAHGRALGDDLVIAYVIAALKVIADPSDDAHQQEFLKVVLPPSLMDLLRTKVEQGGEGLRAQMEAHARSLSPRAPSASKLWRALFALRNLESLGRKHDSLQSLVEELLSQRVGVYKTKLEELAEDPGEQKGKSVLTDPDANPEVVSLATRLTLALDSGAMVWVQPMGGAEIPLRAMLRSGGFTRFALGPRCPDDAEPVSRNACPSCGVVLGVFKALQLVATRYGEAAFTDFTAVDIETTGKDVATAEITQLGAVRVRDGRVVAEWASFVKPRVPIHAAAAAVTGITEKDLEHAPFFEEVWPGFRDFCGTDIAIAHNGYRFDFPILDRMSEPLGGRQFVTYDTLVLARELHPGSRRLEDLAVHFQVNTGHSHRADDDARTLAEVFVKLDQERVTRSRKTALSNLLNQLGLALVLSPPAPMSQEFVTLKHASAVYALGRYSDAIEQYRVERELAGDPDMPDVENVIERLGGRSLMERLRVEKSADERYPQAMSRLRRLIATCDSPVMEGQINQLLELVALSKHDGSIVQRDRVSLLTLHSTKGLEFSRVYIVGVEDAEMPGGTQHRPARRDEIEEGRRLLYVGMTRAKDRLVLTRAAKRRDLPTGGIQFLAEMGLKLEDAQS